MVACVMPEEFENFPAWRFWDGQGWNADMQQVEIIASNVSIELSVSALTDGRYALVFTLGGLSPTVGLWLSLMKLLHSTGAKEIGRFNPALNLTL